MGRLVVTKEADNEAFVRDFQMRHGLTADGWAGKATNAKLDEVAPVSIRRASDSGIALIHSFESLKLTAYKDPGSKNGLPITNGWGTTRDSDGRPIPLGVVWDKDKADRLFRRDLLSVEQAVAKLAPVTTQAQFDALVSFTYNLGEGNLRSSTLLKKHNAGDYDGAADEFLKWVKNDGVTMKGLVRRREAERAMYLS